MLATLAELALCAFLCPLTLHLPIHHGPVRFRLSFLFGDHKRAIYHYQNFHDGHTGHILDEKDIRHLAPNTLDAS